MQQVTSIKPKKQESVIDKNIKFEDDNVLFTRKDGKIGSIFIDDTWIEYGVSFHDIFNLFEAIASDEFIEDGGENATPINPLMVAAFTVQTVKNLRENLKNK